MTNYKHKKNFFITIKHKLGPYKPNTHYKKKLTTHALALNKRILKFRFVIKSKKEENFC